MNTRCIMIYFLKMMIEKQEINIVYEPVIDIEDNTIEAISTGIEYNFIFKKEDFISKLRELEIYFDLLEIYLDEVFERYYHLSERIIGEIPLRIRFSKDDIMHEEFAGLMDYIDKICQDFEIEKNKVVIEISSNKIAKDKNILGIRDILKRGYEID